jgi:hypothetical protein
VDLGELWTGLLDVVGQVMIPVWKDLIQYLPLLLLLLVIASLGGLAWSWQHHSAENRSRVARPVPAGHKPDDVHMPGPSAWPLVAPVGLLLIVFAVVFGPLESFANMLLLGMGAGVAVIGIAGWYLDARKEYVEVESGGHGGIGGSTPQAPAWSLAPPEGMHLPGPSAWPFLAPVGLLFMVAGLIFGPALLVGGLIMAVIAVIGWLLDAGRELDDIEAHDGHPSQADRDPERAWPRRLIPVFFFVGAMAILLTMAPWLLSLLPGSG